ncbi:formate dehydrogenase-N subunit alpha [Lichenibacterium minor]|uniref:Formate dehydrogenase-N subunit alpha n=3 Tax=Lichenibacterium minor TaxID=2316528 RepID=A0A4Q2U9I8_9HYPH|nr:formate dehydrogenase-N subunit alpha [Lichenibacterium minor]
MTQPWTDIKNTDLAIVMGGNAAEAHPCGFKWLVEAKAHRGAKLIVVDPRYTRTAAVSDYYAPIRQGTDIAFLLGVIRYCIANDKIQWEYAKNYTNISYLVKDGFSYKDGLFTGYDEMKRDYDRSSWDYQLGADGFVQSDMTLQHPRTVWQLLKDHVEQYTPELVERICGTPKDKYLHICEMIAATSAPDKAMTSMYALGWTQHSKGAQNIRTMAMLQLLLGNIGIAGGGMNALRGHSNIQGLTDLGLMSNLIPGYLSIPTEKEKAIGDYLATRQFKPLRADQTSYWRNYDKFFVSFQKSMWGDHATKDNDWGYDYLPKLDVPAYDILRMMEMMNEGKVNGYFCQGFNPILSIPNRAKTTAALSKLKYLVTMDPLDTETSNFWRNFGIYNDVKSADIKTQVFQLPTTCFAEEEGSLANSGRWLQWHWAGGSAPGDCKHDTWIMAQIFLRVKKLYQAEGGAYPDPIVNLTWNYADAEEPTPEELAKEVNGYALADQFDAKDPTKLVAGKGKLLVNFSQLKNDGSTSSGCWIYSGQWNENGNNMARRDNADPGNMGTFLNWTFAWPVNRRVLYNAASCDMQGKPWDPSRKLIEWNGSKWVGNDVPDIAPDAQPGKVQPFILNQEGTARLFTRALLRDGPFPVHYEPFESPVKNVINPAIRGNPVARIFQADVASFGDASEFPYAATSYRLTEHFHYWTKHNRVNSVLQPEFFVEISHELAAEKSIQNNGWVRVWSKRGEVKAKAYVTKRIQPLICDGKAVHVVGIPLHWGFMGAAVKGWGPNSLTPVVGDANSDTPEFKAFLVNIEPTTPPAVS